MRTLIRIVNSISERTGEIASWLCVVMMLALVYESAARYIFNAPTKWSLVFVTILVAAVSVCGFAYNERYDANIRIDVIYSRYSPKGKTIFDIVLSLLLFFPLLIMLIYVSIERMLFSFKMHEVIQEGVGWMPPVGPLRALIVFGLALFCLQGLAKLISNLRMIVKDEKYD